MFLLALTYGLERDPKGAIERVIARVRRACEEKRAPFELIMSSALSDGSSIYTVRFASGTHVHSQYYSTHAACMQDIDDNASAVPPRSVVVVSEPLDQSMEHWTEMPVGAFATIRDGTIRIEELCVS